jgi:hypothetical protein
MGWQYQPTSSNPATPDVRNQHEILDYDDTTAESGVFSGIISENYDGGHLSFIAEVAMTSATSGTAGLLLAVENVSGQNLSSDSFASTQTITAVTVAGTAGVTFQISGTLSASRMDSLSASDPFRIKVTRDVTNDTASGDMELWGFYANEA